MESDSMVIQIGSSLGSLIGVVTKVDTRRIDGCTHYHVANASANPPTPISGTKVNTSKRPLRNLCTPWMRLRMPLPQTRFPIFSTH
ncbi:hypothetical protein V6N13_001492 [Hibiscus sabdariffa]